MKPDQTGFFSPSGNKRKWCSLQQQKQILYEASTTVAFGEESCDVLVFEEEDMWD